MNEDSRPRGPVGRDTSGQNRANDAGQHIPGADIAGHLARHGVKAEVHAVVAPDLDVGTALLSAAADFGTDLMVMGGYGHSRLRELALGGATRHILASMTMPVLMSH